LRSLAEIYEPVITEFLEESLEGDATTATGTFLNAWRRDAFDGEPGWPPAMDAGLQAELFTRNQTEFPSHKSKVPDNVDESLRRFTLLAVWADDLVDDGYVDAPVRWMRDAS